MASVDAEDTDDPFLAGVEAELAPCESLVVPGADSKSWFVGPPQDPNGEPSATDTAQAESPLFDEVGCGDRSGPFSPPDLFPTENRGGITFALESIEEAAPSGRGFAGGHCAYSLWRSEPEGRILTLTQAAVPPFQQPREVVRQGDAAWIALRPSGDPVDYPKGGGRIVAVDLCSGAVRWVSADWRTTGPLLHLDGRLISVAWSPTEGYSLAVTDARTGEELDEARLEGPLTQIGYDEGWLILQSSDGGRIQVVPVSESEIVRPKAIRP